MNIKSRLETAFLKMTSFPYVKRALALMHDLAALHRSEHRVVVNGSAMVINDGREILINTDETTFIPAGHKHRLTNPGATSCVMIEVQSGGYVGEDDIVRFEDAYGRVSEVA